MIGKCIHDDCDLRNEHGYCRVTACANPLYRSKKYFFDAGMPSRYCVTCGRLEFENAAAISDAFWLCEECRGRLKKCLDQFTEEVNESLKDLDPALCTQDEIQHVGYDEAQCGREK